MSQDVWPGCSDAMYSVYCLANGHLEGKVPSNQIVRVCQDVVPLSTLCFGKHCNYSFAQEDLFFWKSSFATLTFRCQFSVLRRCCKSTLGQQNTNLNNITSTAVVKIQTLSMWLFGIDRSLKLKSFDFYRWLLLAHHAYPQKRVCWVCFRVSCFPCLCRFAGYGETSWGFRRGDHPNEAYWGAKARNFWFEKEDEDFYGGHATGKQSRNHGVEKSKIDTVENLVYK